MLKQNNVAVIATSSQPQQLEGSKTLACLMEQCATRIYVPDDIAQDYTSEALGLSESDSRALRRMHRNDGEVLLKQGRESIGLRLNLDHAQDVKAIYSNDIKNLIAAGGRFASIPKGNN
jgi:type IV secretory pathway VirB4 component